MQLCLPLALASLALSASASASPLSVVNLGNVTPLSDGKASIRDLGLPFYWQQHHSSKNFPSPKPQNFRGDVKLDVSPPRSLQETSSGTCNAAGFNLNQPPSWKNYSACFQAKLLADSGHDWSVPGAEMDAKVDCWCEYNITDTISGFSCCNNAAIYPMCTIDCSPDCSSELATKCIEDCPPMCFEASEYAVESGHCSRCSWTDCWPVMKCLTEHAKESVENGTLDRTCHEPAFTSSPEISNYWTCWKNAPKHSSHWAVFSAIVHCICREDMINLTKNHSCCDSALYGSGVCDLECLSEATCATQEAQTCIHTCQETCTSFDNAPSSDCVSNCISTKAKCRKYASCRAPMLAGYICDDGRWPQSNSGCCETTTGGSTSLSCPTLCDTSEKYIASSSTSQPWWTRYQPSNYGTAWQCTCKGCPETLTEAKLKLSTTVEADIWSNGQAMLVDIAQKAGLLYGPNRKMQELMAQRNTEILALLSNTTALTSAAITAINEKYTALIEAAAEEYGDDPVEEVVVKTKTDSKWNIALMVTAGVCTLVIVIVVGCATRAIISRKRQSGSSPVLEFAGERANQVVVGSPVLDNRLDDNPDVSAASGAPVRVQAATKGGAASSSAAASKE